MVYRMEVAWSDLHLCAYVRASLQNGTVSLNSAGTRFSQDLCGVLFTLSSSFTLVNLQFIIIMDNLTIDNGLFYVIEFYDGIQIIPDKWVIEHEMLAYWPKVKSDKDFDTIVYTRSSIKDDWSLESIKTILYKTGSFSNAKIKLKKAEYESDIDSPYNTDEKKKKRRDNAKIQFSDNSEQQSEQQSRGKKRKIPQKTNLPSLPEVPIAVASAATYSKTDVTDNSSSVISAGTHSKTYVSNNSSIASAGTHSKACASDNFSSSIALTSMHETAASLKEVESMIENNSAFKKNLVKILYYYFIY
ncbi:uncharacterized protein LOC143903069 isoform X2 [Temnothorax americanus]|uniref:uncharacterized protein LOC143903069 isoform X2 n=1 Tax=Temnothorax americanus TaxID=1964332 RepID=UPI0040691AD5